jgi:hypothetical protein
MIDNQNNESTGEKQSEPVSPPSASQLKIPPKTPNPPERVQMVYEEIPLRRESRNDNAETH